MVGGAGSAALGVKKILGARCRVVNRDRFRAALTEGSLVTLSACVAVRYGLLIQKRCFPIPVY